MARKSMPTLMAHRYTLAIAPPDHYPCTGCKAMCHPRNVGVTDRLTGPLCDDCAERVACELTDVATVLNGMSEYLWHLLPQHDWEHTGELLGNLLAVVNHPTGAGADAQDAVMHVVNHMTEQLREERAKSPRLAVVRSVN